MSDIKHDLLCTFLINTHMKGLENICGKGRKGKAFGAVVKTHLGTSSLVPGFKH